jgi:hypothetical protein
MKAYCRTTGWGKMAEPDDKNLEKKTRMAAIDIVSAIVIMAVSVAVIYWSLHMPWERWARAPGLVPVLFAGTMFIMGLALLISALRNRGYPALRRALSELSLRKLWGDTRTRRTVSIIALVSIYLVVLTGRLPFELAGFLFLLGTFAIFWRKGGWLRITLVSLLVPVAFGGLFRLLFKILLPGDSIFDWFM